MVNILFESIKNSEHKVFRKLQWRSSNNTANSLTETFWSVRTNFRLFTFVEYWKMKMFLFDLPVDEQRMIFDAPGVLNDKLFFEAMLAKRSGIEESLLLQRVNNLQKLLGRDIWSFHLFNTKTGVIRYEIQELRRSIRQAKKYSGYVRNSSSVGSKRGFGTVKSDPETFEWNPLIEEIDYYRYLTVGLFAEEILTKVIFSP